jgi:O-antigen/teichoic acid export membrane protein
LLTFALIATGLAGRSALDKVLALRGGGDLVALWAQLASLVDLVSGVALAGLGPGLAVYAARTRNPERQRELLREALKIGLALALPFALLATAAAFFFADFLGGGIVPAGVLTLAALVGWIAVIPGLIANLWLGQQRRGLQVALAGTSSLLAVAVAFVAPPGHVLPWLVAAQALPALAVVMVSPPADKAGRFRSRSHPLRRYILPSLAIGLLSPASSLAARALVGEALSWHDAGVLQALWRLADWVGAFASGVLSVYYLPQLAAERERERFAAILRSAALRVLLPSAAVLALIAALYRPLVAALYDQSFQPSLPAVALLFAGSWMRIAAWVALYGLYALRRTRALALGELFSLPLFAVLVLAARGHLSLELVGAFWLVAYCAYLAFNVAALRR